MKDKQKENTPKPPPFTVDRNCRTSLVDQVADGLRQAIVSGYYRPGGVLPSWQALSRALGVSLRIPREAIAKLADEGLVISRPFTGCTVLPRNATLWRGHVLVITSADNESSYSAAEMLGEIRKQLAQAGYLYTCVTVARKRSGVYDLSLIEPALRQSIDLAFLNPGSAEVSRRLEKAGIPHVMIGGRMTGGPHCVGRVRVSYDAAVSEFVRRCLKAGVRSVVQAAFDPDAMNAVPALRRAGIAAEQEIVRPQKGCAVLEAVERGAMNALLPGNRPLPDLFLFADDFIAFGALTALLARGVRIPEDVRVVTWSNSGFGPVFPISLARIKWEPRIHGRTIALYLLEHLRKGNPPRDIVLSPVYVGGRSFPG